MEKGRKQIFPERKPEHKDVPSRAVEPKKYIEPQSPSEKKGATVSENPPLREPKK